MEQQRISKMSVESKVTLSTGKELEGKLFVRPDERVSDLLNDPRDFLPLVLSEDETLLIRKSSISHVLPMGEPKAQHEQTSSYSYSSSGFDKKMDRREAIEILGVSRIHTIEDVKRAFQTQIKLVHPDHGGSPFLASKVTEARNLLLANLKKADA